jgi:colanic acid/amylovoran biosynthesis glycosyltransferase
MKKKILVICGRFPNVSETFIRDQISFLVAQGYQVDIFASSYIIHNPLLSSHKNIYGLHSNLHKLLMFPYYFGKSFLKNPRLILKSINFYYYGREALFLKLFYAVVFLANKDYDVILAHFGWGGNVGSFLKENLFSRAKMICTFHGADIRASERKNKNLFPQVFQYADILLSVSPKVEKFYKKYNIRDIPIVDMPFGVQKQKCGLRCKTIDKRGGLVNILSVGRLVEEKGYDYAIAAIKMLIHRNPKRQIKYSIIGAGPMALHLNRLILEHQLENTVYLLGSKYGSELKKYFCEADVFLMSSITETGLIVTLEASSFGLPVIATDVGRVTQQIIDGVTGFIVKPKSARNLARKLEILSGDEKMRKSFGLAGKKFVEEFYDSEKLNERLRSLIERECKKK